MFNKKKKFLIVGVLVLSVFVYIFTPKVESYFRWKMAVEAAGAMPYQIGLTNVVMIKCFTTGVPPICNGGMLCYTKDPATCTNYYDVSGTPAGGMGSNALFSITQTSLAGLTPGGQLIAGGMSSVLMDNGVLASAGGCSGCMARIDTKSKIKKWIYDFIIAGSRGD